jgi:hypothetical protein
MNICVWHMAKEKPTGHTLRKDSQTIRRQVLNRNIQGKRERGRPKRRKVDEIGKKGNTWKGGWNLDPKHDPLEMLRGSPKLLHE